MEIDLTELAVVRNVRLHSHMYRENEASRH